MEDDYKLKLKEARIKMVSAETKIAFLGKNGKSEDMDAAKKELVEAKQEFARIVREHLEAENDKHKRR